MTALRYVAPLLGISIATAAAAHEVGGGATPITYGQSVSGTLDTTVETDTYTFEATPGTIVYLDRTAPNNPTNLGWRLHDVFGRTVSEDPNSLDDLGPVALVGGEYAIEVFSTGGTDAYTFALYDAAPRSFTTTLGGTASGNIDVPGREETWDFTASEGQVLFLDLTSPTSNFGRLGMELVDEHGRARRTSLTTVGDFGPFPLRAGTFRLRVFSNGGGITPYTYQLVDVVHDAPVAIAIGDTVSGGIAMPGQSDVYTFSATGGERVALDLLSATPPGNQVKWSVEDATGRFIHPSTDVNDAGAFSLLAGTYTIRVQGATNDDFTGTYQFKLVPVADDATAIALDTLISGGITEPGERDVFTFTASAGQMVHLDEIAPANDNNNWSLADAAGRMLLARSTVTDQSRLTLMGGTYTLAVEGKTAPQRDNYNFVVRTVADTTAGIAIGVPVTETVPNTVGQRRRYMFTATPGQLIRINTDETATSSTGNFSYTLTDDLGRTLLGPTTNLNDVTTNIALIGGATRTYTLTVAARASLPDATGTWKFTLTDQGTSTFVPSGTPFALDDVLSGSLANTTDIDDYAVTVADGTTVFLDLQTGNSSLRWTLFDPVGQAFFTNVTANNTEGRFRSPRGRTRCGSPTPARRPSPTRRACAP